MKRDVMFRFGVFIGLLMMGAVIVDAQVVFTYSDFASPGTVFYYNVDTSSGTLTPGPSGSGQNWTFNSLSMDIKDTLKFLNPASTPYGNDFPSATHAVTFQIDPTNAVYIYLQNSSTGVSRVGVGGTLFGASTKGSYTPDPLLEAQFPAQVGVSFNDSGAVDLKLPASAIGNPPGIDSVKVTMRTKNIGNADADGSITLNGVTYNNVLRGKFTTFDETRYYAKGALTGGNWVDASSFGYSPQYDTTVTYSWFSPAYGYAVFEIVYKDLNETKFEKARYLDTTFVSIDPVIANDLDLRFMVISSQDRLYHIHYNGKYTLTTLSVTDLMGREYPVDIRDRGKGDVEFHLPATMASGAYVLKAMFDGKHPFVRIIVVE